MLAIAGDSWGCGVWGVEAPPPGIKDPIFSRLFVEAGVETVNVSKPGGSNTESCARLRDLIITNPHLKIDQALVFQTDYIRDILDQIDQARRVPNIAAPVLDNYQQILSVTLSKYYCQLNNISTTYGVQIQLVGGCSDTIWLDNFTEKYPGVNIACQSITNLLVTGSARTESPTFSTYNNAYLSIVQQLRQNSTQLELEQLVKSIDLGQLRNQTWKSNPDWFFPDGIHPNEQGCTALVNYLMSNQHIRKTI
jgi:hypothetical protein